MSARVLVVLGNIALNGQERGNIEVYRSLAGAGVDSLFVTHATWGGRFIQPYLDRLGLRWTQIEYARHFRKSMSLVSVLRNLAAVVSGSWAFWKVARAYRPTHVHVANPHYVLCVLPALFLMRAPLVYRAGDTPTLHHALYRTLLSRFIVPRTRRFVCISAFVERSLHATGVPPEKTRVIHSPPPERPPPERLPPGRSGLPAVPTPPRGGRTVVYLGQVSPHKGVHHLLEAVRALPDVRVLVAGRPSSEAFAKALLALADPARVRFVGYLEDVEGLFAEADIHAAPSLCEEALGNVVLEAKRAGVPSVVYPDGGLPELIAEPGVDGVVCTDRTAEALRAGLEHYLRLDDDALRRCGEAAAASLSRLGATEATFRAAWLDVLRETA